MASMQQKPLIFLVCALFASIVVTSIISAPVLQRQVKRSEKQGSGYQYEPTESHTRDTLRRESKETFLTNTSVNKNRFRDEAKSQMQYKEKFARGDIDIHVRTGADFNLKRFVRSFEDNVIKSVGGVVFQEVSKKRMVSQIVYVPTEHFDSIIRLIENLDVDLPKGLLNVTNICHDCKQLGTIREIKMVDDAYKIVNNKVKIKTWKTNIENLKQLVPLTEGSKLLDVQNKINMYLEKIATAELEDLASQQKIVMSPIEILFYEKRFYEVKEEPEKSFAETLTDEWNNTISAIYYFLEVSTAQIVVASMRICFWYLPLILAFYRVCLMVWDFSSGHLYKKIAALEQAYNQRNNARPKQGNKLKRHNKRTEKSDALVVPLLEEEHDDHIL